MYCKLSSSNSFSSTFSFSLSSSPFPLSYFSNLMFLSTSSLMVFSYPSFNFRYLSISFSFSFNLLLIIRSSISFSSSFAFSILSSWTLLSSTFSRLYWLVENVYMDLHYNGNHFESSFCSIFTFISRTGFLSEADSSSIYNVKCPLSAYSAKSIVCHPTFVLCWPSSS